MPKMFCWSSTVIVRFAVMIGPKIAVSGLFVVTPPSLTPGARLVFQLVPVAQLPDALTFQIAVAALAECMEAVSTRRLPASSSELRRRRGTDREWFCAA